jgi:hypothetical protein
MVSVNRRKCSFDVLSRAAIPLAMAVLFAGCGGGSTAMPSTPGTTLTDAGTLRVTLSSTPSPTIHLTRKGATFDSSGNMTEDGVMYPFIFKGSPRPSWVLLPWASSSEKYRGYRAFGLEVDPTGSPLPPVEGTNDKAELTFAKFPLQVDTYTGFAMKFGASTTVPSVPVIVFQQWQGSPYGPPLSLQLVAGASDFRCQLVLRNNNTGGNPSAKTINIPAGTCQPGTWHTFVIHSRMHYVGEPGNGVVQVWHNDMTTPIIDWTGDVGYDPSRGVKVNGTGVVQGGNPNTLFTSYYGPYRPNDKNTVQSFFANLKFDFTFANADPTQP